MTDFKPQYELAKKLKDAGYPQKGDKFFTLREGYIKVVIDNPISNPDSLVLKLTLSGLIEQCGELVLAVFEGFIIALATREDINYRGRGSTPEEAVAKLWLVLNKHD